MGVIWTRRATEQLDGIFNYISLDSPVYALRFIEKILERVELAASQPESGRLVPEYTQNDIREVFVGVYRIIYLITSSGIEVLSVIHGARLLPDDIGQ